MPLTTTTEMLKKAQEQGYAVGAFNVENMEMAQAIIGAAEELKAPVILQTTPSTVRYAGTHLYAANVRALAERTDVPVALHLDHGDSFALCVQALRSGYTSVMIDGSKLPLEENICWSTNKWKKFYIERRSSLWHGLTPRKYPSGFWQTESKFPA